MNCFPNSKPWITSELKVLLKEEKRGNSSDRRDRDRVKRVMKELKGAIKKEKRTYKAKIENQLRQEKAKVVWQGMRNITGFNITEHNRLV